MEEGHTTQFDILRSGLLLRRDGGLPLPPGLRLQLQPRVFAGDFPSLNFQKKSIILAFQNSQRERETET